jgi:2-oxoglutarate dehydrogenase E1 component
MGFEYGYSLDWPDGLVMWEAQFGDFVNAGQVVIDQFIASAEVKWRRLSGLVLLLPHGFEGQGPEHSSARLERFLSLAAQANFQVVYPTTPAQYFHCLRRQALRRWRKPLVVMTPKSLLRRRQCTSKLNELARGHFRCVRTEGWSQPEPPAKLLLCSGKIYYDLDQRRRDQRQDGPPIIRLEQLYPFPAAELATALAAFAAGTRVAWVQEEPENMGAWWYLRQRWDECIDGRFPLEYIGRPASASPATGSTAAHDREQRELVKRALASNNVAQP